MEKNDTEKTCRKLICLICLAFVVLSILLAVRLVDANEKLETQETEIEELKKLSDVELMDCPFCGSGCVVLEDDDDHYGMYYISCHRCHAQGPRWGLDGYGFSREDAIRNWNELPGRE